MPYDAKKNVNQNARPTDYVPEVIQNENLITRPEFQTPATPASYTNVEGLGLSVPIINEQAAKQVATVQAQMVLAKQFPRNREAVMDRIQAECSRITLAEKAAYRYQRGGTDIFGASIDLLRSIAQCWGNLESGWKEVERVDGTPTKAGYSKIITYAIDFETNLKNVREVTVYHSRENGKVVTDDRDIYELTANKASRRERACLEAIIPKDVVDWALDLCIQTSTNYNKKHMDIGKMLNSFRSAFGVSKAQIEQFIGRKAEAMDVTLYVRLRSIYKSLQDGVGKVSDFFKPVEETTAIVQESTVKEPRSRKKQEAQPVTTEASPAPQPAPSDEVAPAQTEESPAPSVPSMYSEDEDAPASANGELTDEEYRDFLAEEDQNSSSDDDLEDEGDY